MVFHSRLVERYVAQAIVPYLCLALLLLTMILFVQQSSRFAELLLATRVPLSLLAEISASLLPNVLAFTLPMATLAGTIIGLSRLNGDSELTAMRAAGISDLKILSPALLLGFLLTLISLFINLELAPESAKALRRTGLQAALRKLDSPVEPKTFTTAIPGYVVYVRNGDKSQGIWERVFIYSKSKDGTTRLITARSGRIDSAAEQSELVLDDAVATTIPGEGQHSGEGQYVSERLARLRFVLETGRKGLLERLRRDDLEPDEMKLDELSNYARTHPGAEGREAATLIQRRLAFSVSPLVFALLGAGLGLRFGRGGKGWGSVLSLVTLMVYYMISLFGEQMSRKGTLPPCIGMWLATFVALVVCVILLYLQPKKIYELLRQPKGRPKKALKSAGQGNPVSPVRLINFPALLDRNISRSLLLSGVFSYLTLMGIFLIFTLFELWRFINPGRTGIGLVSQYLFFLTPMATVQLLPASLLIAVLTTYALMARRSEVVVWWSSGQSVYRLMAPGILFALLVGAASWLVQEKVMPQANLQQDGLRAQIRGGATIALTSSGKQWLASAQTNSGRIYSYEYNGERNDLTELTVYEFDVEGVHLRRIVDGHQGSWMRPDTLTISEGREVMLQASGATLSKLKEIEIQGGDTPESFKLKLNKPSYLSSAELSEHIRVIKLGGRSVNSMVIALQRKYAEPLGALTVALFGIPLALSFGRRSAITALSSAVAIGLAFWGGIAIFQQAGEYGLLPPPVAVWSPLIIFAAVGVYLLTRMRT